LGARQRCLCLLWRSCVWGWGYLGSLLVCATKPFKSVIGQTPADYLLSWRVSLAQKLMREGRSITLIAAQVGYESPSALSRAFRRKTGLSPRDWLKDLAGENDGKKA